MKIVEESGSRDIREALGENTTEGKQRIEKAIKYLVKEGFLIKKRRIYQVIKKGDWKDSFFEESKTVNYKMPYFHDFATFRTSDLVIIGGGPKIGKTHICLNIIKRLVAQGKKPYYISLESGNRFSIIAEQLGLKDGDFNWCVHFNPETIELEPDAITIIDWILPTDYAETDKLFKHFAEQLVKHGGNMIAFVQLKDNNEFFAKNMIPFFPSLVSRYIYDNPEDGATGYFQLDYIREPKIRSKTAKVMCAYDWDAKELKRIDEFEAKPQKTAVSTIQTREELLLGGENV
jgi:CRISPR/Cas system-associated protein endoribonuclease Cas2